jgi:hypothetical protein
VTIDPFRSRSSDELALRLCDRTLHIPVAELPAGQQRGDTFEIGCAPRSRDRLRRISDLGELLVRKRHQWCQCLISAGTASASLSTVNPAVATSGDYRLARRVRLAPNRIKG